MVDRSLARIEALNPRLNLFCFVYAEEALEAARRAEAAVARGHRLGPLHGVPYALKDFTPTRGRTTTLGSRLYRAWVPEEDPPVVERLRAAGGILVGKTTTPEFAHSGFTSSPLWGISRNPWNPARTPGGSSGGSAGAVAAGIVPLAEGSDAGGSIRIPASFCGVVGLKPSLGRVPMHLTGNDYEQIFHLGPIARSARDAALMLAVMQGPDERDPMSLVPGPERSEGPEDGVAGMRVALSIDLGYYDVDPEVEDNTRRAADALGHLGAIVEEVTLPWTRAINDAWFAYWGVVLAALYGHHLEEGRADLDPGVVFLMEAGMRMTAVELKRIEQLRSRQWGQLRSVLLEHDVLLCPTTTVGAPPADATEAAYRRRARPGRFGGYELACPFNFVPHCPVVSVPSGLTGDGLPTGVQVVGRRFAEATVLGVAAALQAALPMPASPPEV